MNIKKYTLALGMAAIALTVAAAEDTSKIDATLCDKDATAATKELYRWMREEVWGKKVISGAHALWDYNTTEAEKMNRYASKMPKMNIYDFQHSYAEWCDYKGTSAADWQKAGGIVGFMWHWHIAKTPFSLQSTAKKNESARGFYTPGNNGDYTYFRPMYATTPGTLEYKVLMKDLEQVKDLLLHYQSQGLTVVWRPFHEAAGNAANTGSGNGAWFWWGIDGPDACKRLWRFVQDYLWENGVHNLIYVWTTQLNDTKWYPGDKYVDIVARDNYDNDSHGSKLNDWKTIRTLYPNKMAALAECGVIPSPENIKKDGTYWLYVAPWCSDDYVPGRNDAEFIKTWLNASDVIISR